MKLIVMAPLACYCGAMIVMMILVTGAVRAEAPFSFDATPGKLPKTVVPVQLRDRARARPREPRASGRRKRRHRGARADGAARCSTPSTRRSAAATIDDGAQRADIALDAAAETATLDFRAAACGGRAPAAHRLHGADQQVRPRAVLRRLSDRQRRQAADVEQTRARRRAADLSVLGRAGFQGELCADRDGAARISSRSATCRSCARSRSTPNLKQVALRADAENVELSVRAHGGRTRAPHGGGGWRDGRRRHHRRQERARALRARQRGQTAAPSSTTISASNIRCPSST